MDKYYKKKNSETLYRTSLTNYGLHFIYNLLNLILPTVILPIFHFITLKSQFLSSFPASFSTFHKDDPPSTNTIWSTIPTTNNGSSELGRPGYKGFYISVIAMNDYVSNFPSKQNFLHCNCKISTLVLQNSPPIPHYWWRQKHSYYNKLLYGSLT